MFPRTVAITGVSLAAALIAPQGVAADSTQALWPTITQADRIVRKSDVRWRKTITMAPDPTLDVDAAVQWYLTQHAAELSPDQRATQRLLMRRVYEQDRNGYSERQDLHYEYSRHLLRCDIATSEPKTEQMGIDHPRVVDIWDGTNAISLTEDKPEGTLHADLYRDSRRVMVHTAHSPGDMCLFAGAPIGQYFLRNHTSVREAAGGDIVLETRTAPGASTVCRAFVSPSTHRIVKLEHVSAVTGRVFFRAVASGFQRIDGVLFASHMVTQFMRPAGHVVQSSDCRLVRAAFNANVSAPDSRHVVPPDTQIDDFRFGSPAVSYIVDDGDIPSDVDVRALAKKASPSDTDHETRRRANSSPYVSTSPTHIAFLIPCLLPLFVAVMVSIQMPRRKR